MPHKRPRVDHTRHPAYDAQAVHATVLDFKRRAVARGGRHVFN